MTCIIYVFVTGRQYWIYINNQSLSDFVTSINNSFFWLITRYFEFELFTGYCTKNKQISKGPIKS